MGTKVKAVCKCGLSRGIKIGGGRNTFKYIRYFPCLCEDCKDVVQVNLLENRYKKITLDELMSGGSTRIEVPLNERIYNCPKCKGTNVIPYTDSKLIGKIGEEEVARAFDDVLTDGNYKCPKCDKMTLKFFQTFIMWD